MKRSLLLFVCFICITYTIKGLEIVPAGFVSGTWTKANSPYQVQGDITVQDGDVLTIEPGVTVEFQGYYYLENFGQIIANGTSGDIITFTASVPATGWQGVKMDNGSDHANGAMDDNGASSFTYCHFEYGKATETDPHYQNGGAIFVKEFSGIQISNCTFLECSAEMNGSNEGGNGGALFFVKVDGVSVTNCSFTDCTAEHNGGAVGFSGDNMNGMECSNITFSNNTITNCDADRNGGAVSFATGITNLVCSSNEMSECDAFGIGSGGNGGAIFVGSNSENVNITDNDISENDAEENGGGIFIANSSEGVVISGNTINDCESEDGNGGGIVIAQDGINIAISENIITNNDAYYKGGGIFFGSGISGIDLNNNTISDNEASQKGGGIFIGDNNTAAVSITENEVTGNSTPSYGGGFFIASGGTVTFQNNFISENSGSRGGGVALGGYVSDYSFQYDVFVNNTASSSSEAGGGAVKIGGGPVGSFTNVTIANNHSNNNGGGIQAEDNVVIHNSIIWGNTADKYGDNLYSKEEDALDITYSDIQGGQAGIEINAGTGTHSGIYTDNIDSDPLFLNPSAGTGSGFESELLDWRIKPMSPTRGYADPAIGYMGALTQSFGAPPVLVRGSGRAGTKILMLHFDKDMQDPAPVLARFTVDVSGNSPNPPLIAYLVKPNIIALSLTNTLPEASIVTVNYSRGGSNYGSADYGILADISNFQFNTSPEVPLKNWSIIFVFIFIAIFIYIKKR